MADHRIQSRRHQDPRGSLVAWEGATVPFPIARLFTLVDLPVGAERGGHAHRECHELVVALSGRLRVTLRTPSTTEVVVLERPEDAVHVPPMHWIDLEVLAPGTVVAVLCSHVYDDADYLRTWSAFEAVAR